MKRLLLLSLAATTLLQAREATLGDVTVESTSLSDVSAEQIRSADLAEALAYTLPSITLVRRSGIANDIILRGQKRDNINVLVDGAKVYGACPNRMDPPTSHIVTQQVDRIDVIEGPYDVEHFGTLSGMVKATTVAPKRGIHGGFGLNAGSFGYRKLYAGLSGGDDTIRFLINGATESSQQYKDGDGRTFAGQIDAAIAAGEAMAGNAFRTSDRTMRAFSKHSIMGKLYVNPSEDQELRLSYTANRSDNVLYPNTPMDALYDNSDLYNADYTISDLGRWSEALNLQYYHSYVDHPMSTLYRKASDPTFPMNNGMAKVMTNHLEATIDGGRIKNRAALDGSMDLTLGVDGSLRRWDGGYTMNGMDKGPSIDDAQTRNVGLFAELQNTFDRIKTRVGLRYDDTAVSTADTAISDNAYQALSGFIYAHYQATPAMALFGGAGSSARVPDGRELYFQKSGVMIGSPDLKQTFNRQADLGVEHDYGTYRVKVKGYYSMLEDYIYFHSDRSANKFVNIDAVIWGAELTGMIAMSGSVRLDFGAAYQHGEKSRPLADQTDKDLADIPPLKGNAALRYAYWSDSVASVEWVGATKWDKIDADNGEQELKGWNVVNLKIDHHFDGGYSLTLGVDNLLDETYAVSNTYKDLTLLSVNPDDDVMLMNEPGRYIFVNAGYTF